jgi:hypothetical protein
MSLAGLTNKKSKKKWQDTQDQRQRICRKFGEPILGNGKYLQKNSNPPGQHGAN